MRLAKKKVWMIVLVLFGAIVLTATIGSQATAQTANTIELTFAHFVPPTHPFGIASQRWMDRFEKEANGRAKIKPYWGGTLVNVKEGLTEARKGTADIVAIVPTYEKSGLDIIKAQWAFWQGSPSAEAQVKIFWQLWDKYPEIRRELEGLKLIGLGASTDPQYLATIKPVKSLADLRGMRIRISTPELGPALKAFGAEGLNIPSADALEMMQKGILQGAFITQESYKTWKLSEVVKYQTNITYDMGVMPAYVMSLQNWSRLPAEIQRAIDATRNTLDQAQAEEMAKLNKEGFEVAKKAGLQLIQFSDSDVKRWNDALNIEMLNIVKDLDAKGLPGTKYYQDVRRLLAEASRKK